MVQQLHLLAVSSPMLVNIVKQENMKKGGVNTWYCHFTLSEGSHDLWHDKVFLTIMYKSCICMYCQWIELKKRYYRQILVFFKTLY